MSLLQEDLYSQLSKTTDGSNKYYNICLIEIQKGNPFNGNDKTASQSGYEVYSVFGKLGTAPEEWEKPETVRNRHIGFYYSQEAATRAADRVTESKRQKGYKTHVRSDIEGYILGDSTKNENIVKHIPKRVMMNASKKRTAKPLFDPIVTIKPKMTTNQKNRFSELID
jgi:predicted DNA-binding WGR domain protein